MRVNVWAYVEAYPDEIESAIRRQDEVDEILDTPEDIKYTYGAYSMQANTFPDKSCMNLKFDILSGDRTIIANT